MIWGGPAEDAGEAQYEQPTRIAMTAVLTVTMNPSIDIFASTERVTPIRKLRCTSVQRDPGGGGINVARVVKRFGEDCRTLYPAGGSPGEVGSG